MMPQALIATVRSPHEDQNGCWHHIIRWFFKWQMPFWVVHADFQFRQNSVIHLPFCSTDKSTDGMNYWIIYSMPLLLAAMSTLSWATRNQKVQDFKQAKSQISPWLYYNKDCSYLELFKVSWRYYPGYRLIATYTVRCYHYCQYCDISNLDKRIKKPIPVWKNLHLTNNCKQLNASVFALCSQYELQKKAKMENADIPVLLQTDPFVLFNCSTNACTRLE